LGGLLLLLLFWPTGVLLGWPLFQWLLLLLSGYVLFQASSCLVMLAVSNPFCLQFWSLLDLVGVIVGILAATTVILIAVIYRLLLAWMPLHVPCSCVLALHG